VIKRQGVSFRHAVELLREGVTPLAAGLSSEGAVKRSTVRVLAPPVAFDADDQALLNQTVGYYHERLLATTEAAEYLAARGLAQPELIAHFKLGVADRTLGLRLPEKNRKAGADIRAQLQKIGRIRDSGHEHFNDTNKLVGYLAAVSRKLDRPLGVVIQSSSAAGKSTLMDAVLAFVPEEDKVKYSAMTGQSLFYMGETNLKHKALAIVEEEGASRASYALKL